MDETRVISFGPFRLYPDRKRLLRQDEEIVLRRKAWDALLYLAQRPGVVVSNRELIDVLWPDTAVLPNALTRLVFELRNAMGGKNACDQYLRTLPKRGVLFEPAGGAKGSTAVVDQPSDRNVEGLIGRGEHTERLLQRWQAALAGQRQVVFVSGLPGVGKSTLLQHFITRLDFNAPQRAQGRNAGASYLRAQGQCLQLHGEGEPYLPILEAFEQLLEQIDADAFVALARRFAPTWLVQLPALVDAEELESLRRSLGASGTRRVVYDAVRLLERLSEQSPLLLLLEDLHWADRQTVDLLISLAERSSAARLIVLASYRPIEASLSDVPIADAVHSLCSRNKAMTIEVDAWSRLDVEAYLDRRFSNQAVTHAFARRLEAHTLGNPLFVQETVDHLVRTGHLREIDGQWSSDREVADRDLSLPSSLSNVVESWLVRQPAAVIDALEAASLVDGEFTVQEVAAATGRSEVEIDDALTDVERRSRLVQLVGTGKWPDATTTLAYRFSHALYQRVLAERGGTLRRQMMHRSIAARLETAYGGELDKIAPRLVAHCEAGENAESLLRYLPAAARAAANRYAYAEAASYLGRAIDIMAQSTDSPAKTKQLAEFQVAFAGWRQIAHGLGDRQARLSLQHALPVAAELGDESLRFRTLMGLCFNLGFGGELDEALRINHELMEIAEAGDRRLLPIARLFLSMTETSLGHFTRALELVRDTIGMEIEPGLTPFWSPDIGLRTQSVVCLALLGRVSDFDTEIDSLLHPTEESGYYANRAIPLTYAAAARLWLGQRREAAVLCAQAVALAEEMQDPTYLTLTRILQAYAELSDQPARLIAEIEAQLGARDARGEPWWSSCFRGWLAEAYCCIGDLDAAIAQTDTAFALREDVFRSETWRIRAEALQAQGRGDEAESCLRRALTIAQAQDAQVFQLRSALALSRLLHRRGRPDGAKETLAAALRGCTNARGSKLYIEVEAELAS